MILPERLPSHGTIAIVSPSWGGPGHLPQRYQRAVVALESLGYRVKPMPHAEGRADGSHDWLSGTREQRVSDLHRAFSDPAVDLVMTSIGGNHCAQLVADLDYDLIAANPKPFCGYSDNTVLHHAIHARTGLVTFYGPALLPEFGEYGGPDPEVVAHWQAAVGTPEPLGAIPRSAWQAVEFRGTSDDERRPRHRLTGEPRRVLRAGSGSGPLLPACLPSMRNVLGTPWEPSFDERILVIEPPEAPYDAELAEADLAHLRLAGVLDRLAGLGVGRSDGWSRAQVEQLHEAVLDAARGTSYPILGGLECTHSAPLMTFPVGVQATIDGDELTIVESAVR